MEFDVGKWHNKLITIPVHFRTLTEFTSHTEALSRYLSGWHTIAPAKEKKTNLYELKDEETKDAIIKSIIIDIRVAMSLYYQQMIVIAVTYLEAMFSEFFEVQFINNPLSMYEFIVDEESKVEKGYIKLSEIVKHKSFDKLISSLAKRASVNASNGSIKKIAKRIHQLTRHTVDPKLIENLQEIFDLRNVIVHEAKEPTFIIRFEKINQAFDLGIEMLIQLGLACETANLPYHDPSYLIEKPPIPERMVDSDDISESKNRINTENREHRDY